jgi:Kef-type K+ transport system membrane component KefB
MDHLTLPQLLGLLVAMLTAAKLFGALAQWIGQPAVLGELLAGVVLGSSMLGIVDPKTEVLHLLSELGVIILLFAIGLETDLKKLLKVGAASSVVAIVGVALPFGLGYVAC